MIERSDYPLFKFRAGLFVPDTWENHVRSLLDNLTYLQSSGILNIEIHQVKEKFGSLRVYYEFLEDTPVAVQAFVRHLVDLCDSRCINTCVECGSNHDVKITTKNPKSGWISPFCAECRCAECRDEQ